ncbi:hypothetical protein CR513_33740 [Mucuna pruriens]|uniref:Uncharacterized protein n=1 Tax=Mucuna pruriens TaxID=157652 RepID=A0A371G3G9_MUCPR|nr:hypothetical protein CR513_33740 [Mucuna pruriens]
MLSIVRMQA